MVVCVCIVFDLLFLLCCLIMWLLFTLFDCCLFVFAGFGLGVMIVVVCCVVVCLCRRLRGFVRFTYCA